MKEFMKSWLWVSVQVSNVDLICFICGVGMLLCDSVLSQATFGSPGRINWPEGTFKELLMCYYLEKKRAFTFSASYEQLFFLVLKVYFKILQLGDSWLAHPLMCEYMLSCVWLFETLFTVALQAPLSLGFCRQEYWSGLPFPPPGDLPDPGVESTSPTWQVDSLPLSHQGNLILWWFAANKGQVLQVFLCHPVYQGILLLVLVFLTDTFCNLYYRFHWRNSGLRRVICCGLSFWNISFKTR